MLVTVLPMRLGHGTMSLPTTMLTWHQVRSAYKYWENNKVRRS
jgi:hypothetical protein